MPLTVICRTVPDARRVVLTRALSIRQRELHSTRRRSACRTSLRHPSHAFLTLSAQRRSVCYGVCDNWASSEANDPCGRCEEGCI
jgi:hypothetical protein